MTNIRNTKSFKAAAECSEFVRFTEGNKKLKDTDAVKFLIFSLPAIKTCPYATNACKKACYALKAERCYPSARDSRAKHFEQSKKDNFVEAVIDSLNAYMARAKYANAEKIVVRIHESGDFYSREYMAKWLAVAKHFEGSKLVFMAYTKSVRYIPGLEIPDNFTFRYSVWDDTSADDIALAKALNLPVYTACYESEFEAMPEENKCYCADCGNCEKCWLAIDMIKCVIH